MTQNYTTMKTNLWSSAAANGLFLALVTIIAALVQTAFPMEGMGIATLFWAGKLATTVGLLYYFMKGFGEEQKSYLYGTAFTYGFVVSFCSNIVISCYLWLHYTFIFPDAMEKSLEATERIFVQYNMDQTAMDLLVKYMPLIITIVPLVLYTIYALIFAAILAAFVKKAEPPFANENGSVV